MRRCSFKGCGDQRRKLIWRVLNCRCRFQLQGRKKRKEKKKCPFSDHSPCLTIFSSLPPFRSFFLSPPPVCYPPSPTSPQSLLDWWSKHRKRAGSVPPHQSRGWAFLRSSCAGVKSLLWFSFHLSSANHRATLMRMNSDPGEEFHSKDGLTPGSQLHHLPPPVFASLLLLFLFQLDSFVHWQNIGKKNSRNKVLMGNRG